MSGNNIARKIRRQAWREGRISDARYSELCRGATMSPIQRAINELSAREISVWRDRGRHRSLASIEKAKDIVHPLRAVWRNAVAEQKAVELT